MLSDFQTEPPYTKTRKENDMNGILRGIAEKAITWFVRRFKDSKETPPIVALIMAYIDEKVGYNQ